METKKKIVSLLFLVLILLGAFCGCGRKNKTKNQSTGKQQQDNMQQTETGEKPGDSEEQQSDDLAVKMHNVFFYSIGEELIETKTVADGESVKSVPKAPYVSNAFFDGWNQSLEHVEEHLSVRPNYKMVADTKNAIGFDSVYSNVDEAFVIDLSICGDVRLSSLELEITFDPNIQFQKVVYCDDSAVCNYATEDGKLYIAMAFGQNLTEAIDLCSVELMANAAANEKPIQIHVNDIALIDQSDEIVNADCSVYCGKIMIVE